VSKKNGSSVRPHWCDLACGFGQPRQKGRPVSRREKFFSGDAHLKPRPNRASHSTQVLFIIAGMIKALGVGFVFSKRLFAGSFLLG
jgi:hypothetical protein